MELHYNRGKVLAFGLFLALIGAALIPLSLSLEADTNARGVRTLVAIFGLADTKWITCGMAVLVLALALSTLRLLAKDGLAARITPAGIEVRHTFGSPLLEWSAIRSIGVGPIPWARGKRGLVMIPHERFPSWHYLNGRNVTLPLDMLKLADGELEDWLLQTIKRPEKPVRKRGFALPDGSAGRARTFGRKA